MSVYRWKDVSDDCMALECFQLYIKIACKSVSCRKQWPLKITTNLQNFCKVKVHVATHLILQVESSLLFWVAPSSELSVILGHSPSVTLCFRLITRNTRQIIHFNSVQIYYKFLYGDTEQSYVLKYIMNDAGVRRANGSVSSSNILFTTMPCFAGPADVCLPGSPHCIDQLLQGCLTHSLLCSALHAHPWFMSDILKTP